MKGTNITELNKAVTYTKEPATEWETLAASLLAEGRTIRQVARILFQRGIVVTHQALLKVYVNARR